MTYSINIMYWKQYQIHSINIEISVIFATDTATNSDNIRQKATFLTLVHTAHDMQLEQPAITFCPQPDSREIQIVKSTHEIFMKKYKFALKVVFIVYISKKWTLLIILFYFLYIFPASLLFWKISKPDENWWETPFLRNSSGGALQIIAHRALTEHVNAMMILVCTKLKPSL